MQLASRLQRFNEPETLKMAKLARELRAQGNDVTGLSLGEPDFDTPAHIKQAVIETPKLPLDVSKSITGIDKKLVDINKQLNGDATLARREFETPPSLNGRINYIIASLWNTTAAPTQTQIDAYEIAAKQFTPAYTALKSVGEEIKKLEDQLEKSSAPYTPGRIPEWKGN